jgi:hypothetical protein
MSLYYYYFIAGHGLELYDAHDVKVIETIPSEVDTLNFIVPEGHCALLNLSKVLPQIINPGFVYDTKTQTRPTYPDVLISYDAENDIGGAYISAISQSSFNTTPLPGEQLDNGVGTIFDTSEQSVKVSFLIEQIVKHHTDAGLIGVQPINIYCLSCRGGRAKKGNTHNMTNMLTRIVKPQQKRGGNNKKITNKKIKNNSTANRKQKRIKLINK